MTTSTESKENAKRKHSVSKVLFYITVVLFSLFGSLLVINIKLVSTHGENRSQTAQTQICKLSNLIEIYKEKHGSYPTNKQGLKQLVTKREIRRIPTDPWGMQYQYRFFGKNAKRRFVIYSFGADRKKGGSGLGKDLYCK